ncbi:hypothetical protein D3C86_1894870 [compost metagenome]
MGSDLLDQFVRNDAAGGLAFAPIEGHTKVRAAGAARKAGIIVGHRCNTAETGDCRREPRILASGQSRWKVRPAEIFPAVYSACTDAQNAAL